MTRTLRPSARAWAPLVLSLVSISLVAGCLGGGDPDPAPPAEAPAEDPDAGDGDPMDPAPEELPEEPAEEGPADVCTPSVEELVAWSFEGPALPDPASVDPEGDPTMLLGNAGASEFIVAPGTNALIVAASAGDFVTLGFTVALLDPSGSAAFTFEAAPGPSVDGVTGEAPASAAVVMAPAVGTWTLQWSLTGYIEGLQVSVDAETCA